MTKRRKKAVKRVYYFGAAKTEGTRQMKDLLGGGDKLIRQLPGENEYTQMRCRFTPPRDKSYQSDRRSKNIQARTHQTMCLGR